MLVTVLLSKRIGVALASPLWSTTGTVNTPWLADVTVNCTDPLASVVVTQTITPVERETNGEVDASSATGVANADVIDVLPGETLHHQIQVTNKGIIAVLIGLLTSQKIEEVQGGVGQGFLGSPEYFQFALQPGETRLIASR